MTQMKKKVNISISFYFKSLKNNDFNLDIKVNGNHSPISNDEGRNEVQIIEANQFSLIQRGGVKTDQLLNYIFERLGLFCATYPILVISFGILFCVAMCGGFFFFSVITDPVELWSPADSTTRLNKNYFDSHFQPFYRTTQLIIRPTNTTPWTHTLFQNPTMQYSSLMKKDFLKSVLYLQNNISAIKASIYDDKQNVTTQIGLTDICFTPLKPDNMNCTIQSILEYYQNSPENLDVQGLDPNYPNFPVVIADWITHFESCVAAPTSTNDTSGLSCLADFGGTVMPFVGLGDYPENLIRNEYGNASALVITYVINNYNEKSLNEPAMAWEKEVVSFLKNFNDPNMIISFSTERSVQDELDRESQSDVKTIVISYMAMFLYITLTLGKYRIRSSEKRSCIGTVAGVFDRLMVDMKFTLGLCGVIIVIFSVVASIGLFSFFHVKATLIIFEVIPFLVLAVGVDNIFILVQNYQRDIRKQDETLEQQIGRIVGRVAPSMLLTSTAESLAFLLGALTDMPAVKIFSLYAALAVFIDFILQITCFVSFMTLDCKRELAGRYNLFCCIKTRQIADENERVPTDDSSIQRGNNTNEQINNNDNDDSNEKSLATQQQDSLLNKKSRKHKFDATEEEQANERDNAGFLFHFFKNFYAPFLLNNKVRPVVILIFMGLLFTSTSFLPNVQIGLDQKLSMPKDSYVLDYFEALEKYLSVGTPVYFVIKNVDDYSNIDLQNHICSSSGCNSDSLLNQISQATLQPNYTRLAIPANSWIDDYFDWLSSDCCRVYINQTDKFCPSLTPDLSQCMACPISFVKKTNRPVRSDFYKYLRFYLSDNPGTKCAKGGHAAYGESLEIINTKSMFQNRMIPRDFDAKMKNKEDDEDYTIGATLFMAYHKPGINSEEFIAQLKHANEISANITRMFKESNYTNVEVFPYW
jgi:Niemann-Pick C1 protein